MKSLLLYFVQVIICSGILYGYYHFFLRNKKFHLYNRYYLLIATCISIIIPFFNIPVYFSTAQREHSVILQTLTIGSAGRPIYIISSPTLFTSENVFKAFYFVIGLFIFLRFVIALFQIKKLLNKYVAERIDHIYFINTEEEGTPFSFFKWLFWNKKIELDSAEGKQIFRHELFHIEQKHSWDIVFLETISCIFWINPFFFFIKKEIKTIHEFLADEFAANEDDKWNYAELLLTQLLGSPNRLVNSFFHNQIKRRIAMITLSKKPGYQYLRKVMVLPIAVIVIFLFAFTYKTRQVLLHQSNRSDTDTLEPVAGNISSHSISKDSSTVFIDSASFKFKSGKAVHLSNVSVKGLDNMRSDTSKPLDDVLIIIDGKKYSSSEALKTINPNDIVSISILKDSAAIAKFGEKGKNGVIEIFTKKHFILADTVKVKDDKPVTISYTENHSDLTAFYIGVGNRMTISVQGIKPEDIFVKLSNGDIEGSNGSYIAHVYFAGKTSIKIYSKGNVEIAEKIVQTRVLPNPESDEFKEVARSLGLKENTIKN